MATRGCCPVTFYDTIDGAFYFIDKTTDVDEDAFRMTECPDRRCNTDYFFKSNDNKFLLLNAENHFQVQNLTCYQQGQLDCKFKIQIYNSTTVGEAGTPVMLYTVKNDKSLVVWCSNQCDIYPKEMLITPSRPTVLSWKHSIHPPVLRQTLPRSIMETKHEAVFYMTKLSASHTYMFRSSKHPTKYLGFKSNDNFRKLVLQDRDDHVDSCKVLLVI